MKILNNKISIFKKLIVSWVILAFLGSFLMPLRTEAQSVARLPQPGVMLAPSASFSPAIIKGITLHPEDPFLFDFIIHPGGDNLQGKVFNQESLKLIKYFLAALTVPEDEMWVNLSPYEENRVIPSTLGNTEMGRDLLAQDYMLKQLTASLMYPENELGSDFWNRVHKRAEEQYGTVEIPMNTFNKVWIVPERAVVYENGTSVFVVESYLKVMLEEDYEALVRSTKAESRVGFDNKFPARDIMSDVVKEIIHEVIIPEIEREVNEGKTFAKLRQIASSTILATWYKKNVQQSILNQIYIDKGKTNGIDLEDKKIVQKIYNQYVEAFKQGVYDLIKEDYDPTIQEVIPKKYFSGGVKNKYPVAKSSRKADQAMVRRGLEGAFTYRVGLKSFENNDTEGSFAMTSAKPSSFGAIVEAVAQSPSLDTLVDVPDEILEDMRALGLLRPGEDRLTNLAHREFLQMDLQSVHRRLNPPPTDSLTSVFGALMKGESLDTLDISDGVLGEYLRIFRELGLLEVEKRVLTQEAHEAAEDIYDVFDSLPKGIALTAQYRDAILLPQIQLALLSNTDHQAHYFRLPPYKILRAIVASHKNLTLDQINGYHRLADQLSDYLIRLNDGKKIFAVIDGLSGSGKSTLVTHVLYALFTKQRNPGNWLKGDHLLVTAKERKALWTQISKEMEQGGSPSSQLDNEHYRLDDLGSYLNDLEQFIAVEEEGEVETFDVQGISVDGRMRFPLNFLSGRDSIFDHEYGIKRVAEAGFGEQAVNIRVIADEEEVMERKRKRALERYADIEDVSPGSPFLKVREALNASNIATQNRVNAETEHLVDMEVHLEGSPDQWRVELKSKRAKLLDAISTEAWIGYQRVANQLADHLIRIKSGKQILAIVDGITGAGKSTLITFLLQALVERGRALGNWIELDDFQKSSQERQGELWPRLLSQLEELGISSANQHNDNYQGAAISTFFKELATMIKEGGPEGEVRQFVVRGLDRYGKDELELYLNLGHDTIVENEYAIHFSGLVQGDDLNPINIRVVQNSEVAEARFMKRTKESYGEDYDVSPDSEFMRKRLALFQSDRFTFETLAEETEDLVDIEVHLVGNPEEWKVVDTRHRQMSEIFRSFVERDIVEVFEDGKIGKTKADGSYVSVASYLSQIRTALKVHELFPEDGFLGEERNLAEELEDLLKDESGLLAKYRKEIDRYKRVVAETALDKEHPEYLWILDPDDGTIGYLNDGTTYAYSLGRKRWDAEKQRYVKDLGIVYAPEHSTQYKGRPIEGPMMIHDAANDVIELYETRKDGSVSLRDENLQIDPTAVAKKDGWRIILRDSKSKGPNRFKEELSKDYDVIPSWIGFVSAGMEILLGNVAIFNSPGSKIWDHGAVMDMITSRGGDARRDDDGRSLNQGYEKQDERDGREDKNFPVIISIGGPHTDRVEEVVPSAAMTAAKSRSLGDASLRTIVEAVALSPSLDTLDVPDRILEDMRVLGLLRPGENRLTNLAHREFLQMDLNGERIRLKKQSEDSRRGVGTAIWDFDRTIFLGTHESTRDLQAPILARILYGLKDNETISESALEEGRKFFDDTQGDSDEQRFVNAVKSAATERNVTVHHDVGHYFVMFTKAQDEYIAANIDRWVANIDEHLVEGVLLQIDDFQRKGLTQHVLTGNRYLTKALLDRLGLGHYFDRVVGAGTWPEGEAFSKEVAIEQLSALRPEENTIVVGDGTKEIKAAKAVERRGQSGRIYTVALIFPENKDAMRELAPDITFEGGKFPASSDWTKSLNVGKNLGLKSIEKGPFDIDEVDEIFLDLDGVVLDTITINRENAAFIFAMIKNGVKKPEGFHPKQTDLVEGRNFYEQRLGNSTKSMIKDLLEELDGENQLSFGPQESMDKLHKDFSKLYSERRNTVLKEKSKGTPQEVRDRLLIPGVLEMIEAKREAGVGIRIISVSNEDERLPILRAMEIDHLFDDKIFVDDKGEKYEAAFGIVRTEGIAPNRSLFVDDAPNVIKGFRERIDAGSEELLVIGMPFTSIHAEEMYPHADHLIADLSGLNKEKGDPALTATTLSPKNLGGIDLNPNVYDLETRGERSDFNMKFINNNILDQNIDGLVPVIINVSPVTNIPLLIGVREDEERKT